MRFIKEKLIRFLKSTSYITEENDTSEDQYYADNSVNRRKGIVGMKKKSGKVDKGSVKAEVNPKILEVKSRLLQLKAGESMDIKGIGDKLFTVEMNQARNSLVLYASEEGADKKRRIRQISLKK
jgi:hypothetical protein